MIHCPHEDAIFEEAEDIYITFLDDVLEEVVGLEEVFIKISSGDADIDLTDTLRKIHSHKGSAGALGYTVMVQCFHQTEEALILWQKQGRKFVVETMLAKMDLIRQAVSLAKDSSISRKEYLEKYEGLRDLLRSQETSNPRILVVESLQAIILRLKEHIEAQNFEVMVSTDGYEALGRLLHEPFEAIVCGATLMGMDGPALIAAVKLNQKTSHIRTALMSSSSHLKLPVAPDRLVQRTETEFQDLAQWLKGEVEASA